MKKHVITDNTITQGYYNISQFRLDTWTRLKQSTSILHGKSVSAISHDETDLRIRQQLAILDVVETYFAYPGREYLAHIGKLFSQKEYSALGESVKDLVRLLVSEGYRRLPGCLVPPATLQRSGRKHKELQPDQHYFEVLFVDNLKMNEEEDIRGKFDEVRNINDDYVYDLVITNTFQDALMAVLFNYNIQSCVIRYGIPYASANNLKLLHPFISSVMELNDRGDKNSDYGIRLAKAIKEMRPEIDLFLVTDSPLDNITSEVLECFERIFYRQEDAQELHLSIRRGIHERFRTPFFRALKEYSQKPTGVFHAMPISRGNSIFKSNWIKDMADFYGRNIFLAETSATTGGLDSLLQPTGPLKVAQQLTAKAFGSQHSYFVTNGTSTANKIVLQALIQPGDVVLIDRDCHKSHHYALVLSGALPVYLDSYPIAEYSMYGAVPLEEIKHQLMLLKSAGRLEKVRMLILTNCTFDGIVYNTQRVMEEILAIKPDMVFLWDEAWFAFARFNPVYRQRTGMYAARKLSERYASEDYRQAYDEYAKQEKVKGQEITMPDPDKVRVRVYSTQSTHKTLSSLRQGSMIHIHDEDFKRKTEDAFHEAYMTHTSTSPNYQILASLDVGRRQTVLEGYELVGKSIELAMVLRERITTDPQLRKYFSVLTVKDLINEKFRQSGFNQYYDPAEGWGRMGKAWADDEFVLDPTKINLHVGRTGVDGDTFKNRYLMDQFGIQINKTSRNTVLFMTNIGTTRSSVAYLLGVLHKIARQLDESKRSLNRHEQTLFESAVKKLTMESPPLPDFSFFHPTFKPHKDTAEGDFRSAFFLSYNESFCEYIKLNDCNNVMTSGRQLVSASFVIPYPPGFPVLVPGQVFSEEIVAFMQALDVKEIHGYRPELGFRVFTENALNAVIPKALESKRSLYGSMVAGNGSTGPGRKIKDSTEPKPHKIGKE